MTGLHNSCCTQLCILIFAFRSCYCLGSFILQVLFQVSKYLLSRDKIWNFSWTFFLLALYSLTLGPAVNRTVCTVNSVLCSLELQFQRFLQMRMSYHYPGYHRFNSQERERFYGKTKPFLWVDLFSRPSKQILGLSFMSNLVIIGIWMAWCKTGISDFFG